MDILKFPFDIILLLIFFLDKPTLLALRFVNKFLMQLVNNLLFKNAFEYFDVHKLIFIYAYTIPFEVILKECPYLRIIALNLCYVKSEDNKYLPDLKTKERMFENCNFYSCISLYDIKPINLLQRMDLMDFKKLSDNIVASIDQLKSYDSFKDIDFIEIMKYLLNQCSSLKTIDILNNQEEINHFNIDEELLFHLTKTLDDVNLYNYWYKYIHVKNFIKNIKKVNNKDLFCFKLNFNGFLNFRLMWKLLLISML